MAYDDDLADRVREQLSGQPDVEEKRMFGGLAFLVAGHMAVAASGQGGLMVRVEPAATAELLTRPGTGPVVMRGREMTGWLRVDDDTALDDGALAGWVEQALAWVRQQPPKRRAAAGR